MLWFFSVKYVINTRVQHPGEEIVQCNTRQRIEVNHGYFNKMYLCHFRILKRYITSNPSPNHETRKQVIIKHIIGLSILEYSSQPQKQKGFERTDYSFNISTDKTDVCNDKTEMSLHMFHPCLTSEISAIVRSCINRAKLWSNTAYVFT